MSAKTAPAAIVPAQFVLLSPRARSIMFQSRCVCLCLRLFLLLPHTPSCQLWDWLVHSDLFWGLSSLPACPSLARKFYSCAQTALSGAACEDSWRCRAAVQKLISRKLLVYNLQSLSHCVLSVIVGKSHVWHNCTCLAFSFETSPTYPHLG